MKFKIAALSLGTALALAGGMYALNPFVNAQAPVSDSASSDPSLTRPAKEPTLKANKGISPDKLIKKEAAIAKAGKGGILKASSLKTFGEFKTKNLKGANNADISPDRLVYEIEKQYPEGVQVSGGTKYLDAAVTVAVDAETGQFVWVKVSSANITK